MNYCISLLYPSSVDSLRSMKYSCPEPELSVDERRQCFADTLLATARECYIKSKIGLQQWGAVQLFTKIVQVGGGVKIVDGWVPVSDVGVMPCGHCKFDSMECRDFMLAIPPVMYVVELSAAEDMTCAIGLCVNVFLVGNEAIHALIVSPLHALQWRNYDYEIPVCIYNYHRPPSCKMLTKNAISDVLGSRIRDLLKISALINYFKCINVTDPWHFEFDMMSGRRLEVLLNNNSGKVFVTVMWPWWRFRSPETYALGSPRAVMDWAEEIK